MRGYSIISDEERQAIIKQHESVYDGYAVGNVPSNMYPLTVADYATDKGGITVNNKGEVTTYKNHLVNESEVKEYASADTNYDEVDPAYDFQSGGPEEFEPDYETDPMDSDIQAIQNMFDFQSQNDSDPDAREMVKNSENAMNQEFSGKEKYGDEENAYDFESDGPSDAYESVIKEDDSKKSLSDIARELMLSQKFEKIANEMEPFDYSDEFEYADNFLNELLSDYDNEDFYDDLFDEVKNEYGDIILSMYGRPDDDDEDMYESVIEENMCEQCGMTETLCECWMKEEVEKDLQESFKKEKERITEMFNRFKKYN
jgi:hypothetical protein